jgi:hypothetical protein
VDGVPAPQQVGQVRIQQRSSAPRRLLWLRRLGHAQVPVHRRPADCDGFGDTEYIYPAYVQVVDDLVLLDTPCQSPLTGFSEPL